VAKKKKSSEVKYKGLSDYRRSGLKNGTNGNQKTSPKTISNRG